jgi:hypothetical protein
MAGEMLLFPVADRVRDAARIPWDVVAEHQPQSLYEGTVVNGRQA